MPDIMNFTLLAVDMFLFPQILLNFVLGCNWVTWKQFDAFESCFWALFRAAYLMWLIYPHYWGKTFLSTLPRPRELWSIPLELMGKSMWVVKLFSLVLWVVLSMASNSLHTPTAISTQLKSYWQRLHSSWVPPLCSTLLCSTLLCEF